MRSGLTSTSISTMVTIGSLAPLSSPCYKSRTIRVTSRSLRKERMWARHSFMAYSLRNALLSWTMFSEAAKSVYQSQLTLHFQTGFRMIPTHFTISILGRISTYRQFSRLDQSYSTTTPTSLFPCMALVLWSRL